ncbi:MAG: hypothetical protein MR878_08685 [Campylobacter sp.]|nr:hypothetical protein [Campylobacter sp.]
MTAQLFGSFLRSELTQPSLFWRNFCGSFLRFGLKFYRKISPATAVDTAPRLALRYERKK